MSLTTGRGPLSSNPAGTFHPPLPGRVIYIEPYGPRVRAELAGRSVLDSSRVQLVHRADGPPTYAFPRDDVAVDAVEAHPVDEVPGHVSVAWGSVDAWFEENAQVFGHAPNPYHRVDCLPTNRRLHVEAQGVTLVDTDDCIVLFETALAPRLYVAPSAVRMDLLVPSATTTWCGYKGKASYWTLRVGDVTVPDVAWTYVEPRPEATPIADMLSFYGHLVDITADLPPAR